MTPTNTLEVGYVLDTNVVSALRIPGRHPSVEQWAATIPLVDLYVTAMTISEIERGVFAKERSDAAQGAVLRQWLEDHVLPAFGGRVLPFDLAAARTLATFRVPEHAPLDDAAVAAVAHASRMTIATRNVRHFEPLGVSCIDPWAAGPT